MRGLAIGVLAALFSLAIASAARADTSCVGVLAGRDVQGNLVVPDGALCTLRDTVVKGDVLVGPDAGLRVSDGVALLGNLRTDRCDYVSLEPLAPAARIVVAGNIDIEECRESSGKLFSGGRVIVGGNFVCRENAAPCYAVSLTVGGDLRVAHNSGGPSFIEGSTVAGNLECTGNSGVSDYGLPNTVAGERLGECAGLSN